MDTKSVIVFRTVQGIDDSERTKSRPDTRFQKPDACRCGFVLPNNEVLSFFNESKVTINMPRERKLT